jgi:trehalose 6-phosphate phosphatase
VAVASNDGTMGLSAAAGSACAANPSVSHELNSAGPLAASLAQGRYALFLDLDGTLVEIAARPQEVVADDALLALLRILRRTSAGALALISGRTLADLDRITAPEGFAAAGMHGFERRGVHGNTTRAPRPAAGKLEEVRATLKLLVQTHPQLLLEDKGDAIALHYRQAPHLQPQVERALESLRDLPASGLRVQHGRRVVEVTPGGVSKATAVAAFMSEEPFQGRVPIYVGDDLTDECAFEWVNARDGLSVSVNASRPRSMARLRLDSVAAARTWLRELADAAAGHRRE